MKIIGYDTVVYRFLKVRAGENVKFNGKIDRTLSKVAFISGKIQQLAAVMNVNLADYQIDHLALRANTEEKAKNWLTELLKCGRILSDNIVNGRPIYLIELDEPVDFIGQPVDVIELPFPKINNIPKKLGNILKL